MHNLSIMAIFKNETMNIKVWLDHYLWQGIEHFYLIDNDSNDNPKQYLNPYISAGLVTYYFRPEQHKQLDHYRFVYRAENLPNKTNWLIIADIDEFFYGLKCKLSNVVQLFKYESVLYCNWIMFGSSGLIQHPEDIRTALIHRDKGFHPNKKYIFKTKFIKAEQIFIHHIESKRKLVTRTINNLVHLNHYPIQSWEFFEKVKMTRGDVNTQKSDTIRDQKYFNEYNQNKIVVDEYLKQLIILNTK